MELHVLCVSGLVVWDLFLDSELVCPLDSPLHLRSVHMLVEFRHTFELNFAAADSL